VTLQAAEGAKPPLLLCTQKNSLDSEGTSRACSILCLKAKEPSVTIPSQLPPRTVLASHGPLVCVQLCWLFRGDKYPSAETPQASVPVTAPKINTFALLRGTSERPSFCLLSLNKYSPSVVLSSLLPSLSHS